MYNMYADFLINTPSCSHVSSYVIWRVQPLGIEATPKIELIPFICAITIYDFESKCFIVTALDDLLWVMLMDM